MGEYMGLHSARNSPHPPKNWPHPPLKLISSEATRFERSENRVRVTSILNGQVAFFLGTNQWFFQGIFRGAWISLFKRNKRFVTRRGIEPGPPGSKVIAVPMRLRRQAYRKRSKIAYKYLIYSKTLKITEITYSY